MRHVLAPLAVAIVVLSAAGAAAAQAPAGGPVSRPALGLRPCAGDTLRCGRLEVPLDARRPSGRKLRLAVGAQPPRRSQRGLLIGLSGGPGQSSVSAADSFAAVLSPLLRRNRLAVLDQRGTGAGALRCPALQRLGALDPVTPADVGACGRRIGPTRAFYTTRDSVADIEALRRAFGARRITLYGVSYGTYVALQYARTHPDRVEALVLDSAIGPDGVDPLLLDSFSALPRILREQCRAGGCRGVTPDPVGDVGALAAQLAAGTVRGPRYDSRGRRRSSRLRRPEELLGLITAGDLNPYLQAALPGAIRSALTGDTAPLVRLREIADGIAASPGEISVGLNVATGCADVRLPYALDSPLSGRAKLVRDAVAAAPADRFAPFDRTTLRTASYADFCRRYPATVVAPAAAGPPPDVPVLLLNGRLDVRTPIANARAVARLFPRAQVVEVPGTGHDQVNSDLTGCVERALRRFAARRRVGNPCSGMSNQVLPLDRAPRSLARVARARGIAGVRGRALAAAVATALDARNTALQRLFAGLPTNRGGGGLRGGSFRSRPTASGLQIRLRRYAYVPGLRVSGTVELERETAAANLTVEGPGRATDGRVKLSRGGAVSATLGGRALRTRVRVSAASARVTRVAADLPLGSALDRIPRLRRGRR